MFIQWEGHFIANRDIVRDGINLDDVLLEVDDEILVVKDVEIYHVLENEGLHELKLG